MFWWVDRERGVGGIVAGQLVPFGGKFGLSSLWDDESDFNADAHVIATWAKVETLLYQG